MSTINLESSQNFEIVKRCREIVSVDLFDPREMCKGKSEAI